MLTKKSIEGIGKILTKKAINFCANKYPNFDISLSAQHRLLNFYKEFGLNQLEKFI